jgi:GntR family transcriptional regulator / MocR family aminotransferase
MGEPNEASVAQRDDRRDWASLFRLEADSGLPLQLQIRKAVINAIGEGRLPAGLRIASCRDLATSLGVARNTVVLAFQQLVSEGVLKSRPRSGFYVPEGRVALPEPEVIAKPPTETVAWSRRLPGRPSAQRNIVKPADWQRHPYPFVYGQFDPTLFPTNDWRECARAVLSVLEIRGWARDLVDGDDEDLVEQLRRHVLPRRGIWAGKDEIILTLGAQHALYLVATLLSGPGVTIGFEDPGYPDARNIFSIAGATLRPIPVDANGLVVDDRLTGCQAVFVTPASQCPTTVPMSKPRRQALIERARRDDFVIIEDDYGVELLGEENAVPALKSIDRHDRVIYVGSLSKVLAPGLRLGYIIAPAELIRELRALRRLMLRHPPSNNQRMVALFLSLGHAQAHFKRYALALKRRAALLDAAVAQHLPTFQAQRAPAASSLWLTAPDGLDTDVLAREALKRGIVIEPGGIFFADPQRAKNTARLGFGSITPDKIEPGIRLLAEVARGLV